MREINLGQSEAKLRLLGAAEQLLAEHGFETVSVRDITQVAKANVAAINYHFGTRDGLLALVVTRYLGPLNDERLVRLDALERKWSGKAVPLEEIVDALVRPLVGIVRKTELAEPWGCRLLGHILALPGASLPAVLERQAQAVAERFLRALGKSLSMVTADELVWRLHLVVGALLHLLRQQPAGVVAVPSLEASLGRLIRFAVAGLRDGVVADAPAKKGPQATFDF